MPEYSAGEIILPEKFEVPECMVYSYMIWALAKFYKLSPASASKLKEIDFWQMTAFENLEQSKNDYMFKLRSGN